MHNWEFSHDSHEALLGIKQNVLQNSLSWFWKDCSERFQALKLKKNHHPKGSRPDLKLNEVWVFSILFVQRSSSKFWSPFCKGVSKSFVVIPSLARKLKTTSQKREITGEVWHPKNALRKRWFESVMPGERYSFQGFYQAEHSISLKER